MRKSQKSSPSLRDKLSANFVTAFEADFQTNGVAVIEALRERHPDKYTEIAVKLIAAAEPPRSLSDFSQCDSQEDVGRQLLMQMGLDESKITNWMIKQAVEANERLVNELESIIAVAAGVSASLSVHDDVDEGEYQQ